MFDLIFRRARLDDDGPLTDVAITGERFAAIGPALPLKAAHEIDAEGRVLLPGLIDAHMHLDKALIHDRLPNRSGTLAEAIAVTAQLKSDFTRADIEQRSDALIRRLVQFGTTHVRTHAEFDPAQGFTGLEAILAARHTYRSVIDIQVVAFPQEGIFKSPGTDRMMRKALEMGADVVGAIPYNDSDPHRHIDWAFDLARDVDRDLDVHQDFRDDADALTIDYLARQTIERGYEGRVSVGHLTALAAVPPPRRAELISMIADAGISVMCLPATDLHLGARADTHDSRRALTPVRELRDGGVNVCLATNNVRNAFTPFGNGDLLQIAALALPACHLGGSDDQRTVLPMITSNAARAMRLPDYGIAVGRQADCVLLGCRRVADVILDLPERAVVVKRGRVVARTTHRVELAF